MTADKSKAERRRSARKNVLETFHVFLVIPESGSRKIYIKDMSEGGLAFVAETSDSFAEGDTLEGFFYLNPSLRLPLSLRVANVTTEQSGVRRIGCEFADRASKSFKVFTAFIGLLDDLSAFVET